MMQDWKQKVDLLNLLAGLSTTGLGLNHKENLKDLCLLLVFSVQNPAKVNCNCCAMLKLYGEDNVSCNMFEKVTLVKARKLCNKSLTKLLRDCDGPMRNKLGLSSLRDAICINIDEHLQVFNLRVECKPARIDQTTPVYSHHLLGACESTTAMECLLELSMRKGNMKEPESSIMLYHQLKRYLSSLESHVGPTLQASMQIELIAPRLAN